MYEVCFCHKLTKKGLVCRRQVEVTIVYDNNIFEVGLRLNVLDEGLIVCELKAVDNMNPVWEAQILSHLRLANKRLGFLITFIVNYIKGVIKRINLYLSVSCTLIHKYYDASWISEIFCFAQNDMLSL